MSTEARSEYKLPGMNWWNRWKGPAMGIGNKLMNVWEGKVQPWNLPEGKQLIGATRKEGEMGRTGLLSSLGRSGYSGAYTAELGKGLREGETDKIGEGLNKIRANYDPRPWVSGQQDRGLQIGQMVQAWRQYIDKKRMMEEAAEGDPFMDTMGKVNSVWNTADPMIHGGGCCFIFIAVHGGLHPVVRAYRDLKMNVRNRRGYYWLSDRLVPLMRRLRFVRELVNLLMVAPMTEYGKSYFCGKRWGKVFAPVAAFWLILFSILGHRHPYRRRGTLEVV